MLDSFRHDEHSSSENRNNAETMAHWNRAPCCTFQFNNGDEPAVEGTDMESEEQQLLKNTTTRSDQIENATETKVSLHTHGPTGYWSLSVCAT
jgi:hypothetical protein